MNVDFGMELQPVCRADLEQLRAWRNDYKVWKYCRQSDLISDVEQEAWFKRQSEDPAIKMYVVVRRVEGSRVPVGVCGLTSIDMLSRRAELSMYIGPKHHGKGYGREAFKLLFIHGFQNLGLNVIWIETIGKNPADKLFDELGFKAEGTRRAFYFKEGRQVDAHLYSILREEWISAQLASSSSSAAASSPTPPSSGHGSPEGATIDVSPINKPPRRRGPGKPKAPSASLSSSATSEPGSSSRRSAHEATSDGLANWLRAGAQGEGHDALGSGLPRAGAEGGLASGIEDLRNGPDDGVASGV